MTQKKYFSALFSFTLALIFSIGITVCSAQTLNLPPRPTNALTRTQFSTALLDMSIATREYWVFRQASTGNIPSWERHLVPITINKTINGTSHTLVYYALPDYFCIGSDTDYFQEPMSPILAQHIANLTGCALPTRLMVNQIWTNSTVKMTANTFSPSTYTIDSVPVFILENSSNRVERNTTTNSFPLGALVSGDKKDLIISSLIYTNLTANVPKPVVIYGWIQPNSMPIQPAYNGHAETYMDYSHGTRLIQTNVILDGFPTTISNILADPTLNVLLSDEGVLMKSYYTLDSTLTPFVITPPRSQTVHAGGTGTFNVTPSGEPPFTYQWKLNTAPISGATNSTFIITNAQAANAGTYAVTIANSYGMVTSPPTVFRVTTNAYPILFSDALTNDTSSNWNLFYGTTDFTTNWAYDFSDIAYTWNGSAFFIPASPTFDTNSARGLRLTVNNTAAVINGINVFPKNQVFSNNFALLFDMWINYPGGANGSGASGTTEYMISGINHTGTEVDWAATNVNVPSTDGIWFAIDGEGGASKDVHAYLGNPSGLETDLSAAAGGLISTNHANAPFPTLFPSTRFESVGSPGKNWVACAIIQSNNVVTWTMDDTILAQRTNSSIYTSGTIMLGYMDIFSSVASPAYDAFILYNNVRVEDRSSAPAVSPTFTSLPVSQTVLSGTNLLLSGSASGTEPIFAQWFFNGNAIQNATNLSLQLNEIQTTNSGDYSVTISNVAGSISSPPVTITVNVRPFSFNNASVQLNGSVFLNFTGAMGSQYTVQTSTNLIDWAAIGTIMVQENPATFADTNAALFTSRFYRLVITP